MLASLLAADFFARLAHLHIYHHLLAVLAGGSLRTIGWLVATAFLSLLFALIYYFGPDVKVSQWRWLTPGSALGMVGWLLASLGLRVYVHYFNNYSATYGSLGTVIILLTWFYLSGLMLLLGGEINSEIEAAVQEKKLAAAGMLKPEIVGTPSGSRLPSLSQSDTASLRIKPRSGISASDGEMAWIELFVGHFRMTAQSKVTGNTIAMARDPAGLLCTGLLAAQTTDSAFSTSQDGSRKPGHPVFLRGPERYGG